jgi:hypothetical protein
MEILDDDDVLEAYLGSDDDIDHSDSDVGDEEDQCASPAAQRADSEPQDEVSPHAHRGAELPPRRWRSSEDSRSRHKREIDWVKEGAKEELINQDFDCHSLHHSDVQSEWSGFIQSAVSASKEMQSAPVAPAASGIPHRTKPSWDRVVGHVPTMAECQELKFMDEFATVEDAGEAMRVTGLRQCTCTLLWGGDKAKTLQGVTTSALWVCKCDVMQFATYLHVQELGDGDDTSADPPPSLSAIKQPLSGFNAEKACFASMKGKGKFVLFLKFLRDHPTEVCGFFCLAQRVTREQVRRYSWCSDKATEVGDILNELQLQRIQGHGKHKRNLWREAQQRKEPDSRANSHLDDGEYVSVITMYAPHRCVPTGREGEEDDVSLETSSLTSAAGLAAAVQRVSMKRQSNCGPSAKALAHTLQVKNTAGSMQEANAATLASKLAEYGPGAVARASQVRRFLISGQPVDESVVNNLFQGAVEEARAHGDYVQVLEASGAIIKARQLELAEARCRNHMKREIAGRKIAIPPFDPLTAGVPDYPDYDERGVRIVYILGWCLAPAYLRNQLQHFCPVSAIDCAFAKRRGGGQGTFYLEAIMGGDRSIHIAFAMHLLGTECDYGCNLHHEHTKLAYNDAFNVKGFVCSSDGGRSLIKGLKNHRPNACAIRDNRHIAQDIKSPRIRGLHAQLHVMPPSRRDEVDAIFTKLRTEDKAAYAVLTSVPVEQWCLAKMPPEAAHHGNKTSSMVEVAAFMMLPARCQNTMAASFFQTLALVRSRWIALYHSFNSPKHSVPVRIQQFEAAALKRASEKKCTIHPQTYQLIDRQSIFTNPASLNVDITVLVLREGPLSISQADPLQKAWSFIHDGRDSVRQSPSLRSRLSHAVIGLSEERDTLRHRLHDTSCS